MIGCSRTAPALLVHHMTERAVPIALTCKSSTTFDRNLLDAFAAEGRAIARAVKAELPDWSIAYFDDAAAARRNYRGPLSSYEAEIPL